ncbi:MAG: ABC transporter substrate-binding protein [Thaumarchaeota archaeon]|nr:ABC transporter substrate-binding protein [Nitrososphaerota archaeon]
MEITVGHTPDADDAFMFYAMLEGKIRSDDFKVKHVIQDIEELNKRALNPSLDVTAVSAHACAYIPNYTILRSGGSFGIGYGPIVISNKAMTKDELKNTKIAIPGKMTSAFLLLQLMIGKFDYIEMNFSQISNAVKEGKVEAGLVIHETQLSYELEGLQKILDVGKLWDNMTGGMPVPLGINVIKSELGIETIRKFDQHLSDSIKYGLAHVEEALDYAMQYSRGKPRDLIKRFVTMYVNDITANMGKTGERTIRHMFELASQKSLVPRFDLRFA